MISKKYSPNFKITKVEEYLEENEKNKISKAEFALKNGISDSTFNDWVLKYQRDKKGFCNITKEIEKIENVEVVTAPKYEVRKVGEYEEKDPTYILDKDYLRLHYNGVVIEFNKELTERVLVTLKKWYQ